VRAVSSSMTGGVDIVQDHIIARPLSANRNPPSESQRPCKGQRDRPGLIALHLVGVSLGSLVAIPGLNVGLLFAISQVPVPEQIAILAPHGDW